MVDSHNHIFVAPMVQPFKDAGLSPVWRSTKRYTPERGLSCAFRQWRAESHCRLLHGYALDITLTFESSELDEFNWVVNFGGLAYIKAWLDATFDHKTLVAEDDPYRDVFKSMHKCGIIDLKIVPATGCEKMAEMVYSHVMHWLYLEKLSPRCHLVSVEVREHQGNAASYQVDFNSRADAMAAKITLGEKLGYKIDG